MLVLEPPTVNRTRIVPSNPLLADPTRSATLRRVWVGDFWSRFQRLKGKINRLVIDQDVFGLFDTQNQERNNGRRDSLGSQEPGRASDGIGEADRSTDSTQASGASRGGSASTEGDASGTKKDIGRLRPDGRKRLVVNVGRWAAKNSAAKAGAFNKWLQTQIQVDVMAGATAKTVEDAYWKKYSDEAYKKGAGRAFDDVKKSAVFSGKEGAFFNGTKQQFLQQSFGRPVAIRKLKRMAGRVFTDLKGVTEDMSKDMTKVLTDGLAQGKNPHEIAKELNKQVGRIGQHRATLIARTEITRVHAEGQLDALEEMGVKEVGVMVEWSTAGDDRVCPLCQPLEGVVLTVKEARGIIPRHPQCRCAHIPANVGEDPKAGKRVNFKDPETGKVEVKHLGQQRGKGTLQTARDKSIKAEIPKMSKRTIAEQKAISYWKGADTKFRKKRPKSVLHGPIESKLGTKPTQLFTPPTKFKAAPKEPAKVVPKITPKPKPITPKPKPTKTVRAVEEQALAKKAEKVAAKKVAVKEAELKKLLAKQEAEKKAIAKKLTKPKKAVPTKPKPKPKPKKPKKVVSAKPAVSKEDLIRAPVATKPSTTGKVSAGSRPLSKTGDPLKTKSGDLNMRVTAPPTDKEGKIAYREMRRKLATTMDRSQRLKKFVLAEDTLEIQMERGRFFRSLKNQRVQGSYRRDIDVLKIVDSPAKINQDKLRLGFWRVGDDGQTMFMHEYGHRIQSKMFTASEQTNWSTVASDVIARSPKHVPLSDLKPLVSDYANTNHRELFAESFAAYTHKSYKPGMLPETVERFMKDLLGF